ncbi:hypothetical protein [Sphingobacterium gobiense]|uniref:Uncharacterized protein n=1 Tax=Sphingobacterium gobiense TaxID=1382456 RepID=A0A2S9JUW1_9SPHI|nr:hypothetical protein [Sphingobacterium gobiense]PRD57066.1 hypothetical protein C5749_07630 [Sphingobacterium gobiense]
MSSYDLDDALGNNTVSWYGDVNNPYGEVVLMDICLIYPYGEIILSRVDVTLPSGCERWLILDNMDLSPEIIAQR